MKESHQHRVRGRREETALKQNRTATERPITRKESKKWIDNEK